MRTGKHVVVVGAGVGGLAAAIRLSAAGAHVTVLEAAAGPGGKMRTVDTSAGPADAGPTVLTMRWVFEDLFRAAGTNLNDHVTLTQNNVIARHFWSDGTELDLMAEASESQDNIHKAFGKQAADEFARFSSRAKRLFEAFEHPMMRAGQPSSFGLAATVLRQPRLMLDMAPGQTLAKLLERNFSDPKLRQLFGRYATYVGGSPYASPALLSLIWHAENSGVWSIKGGMHALALAMAQLLENLGADVCYNSPVSAIRPTDMGPVVDTKGQSIHADAVVFNGDPRALTEGAVGAPLTHAVARTAVHPRSLSADVMAFAAVPNGVELSHHNVFFGDDPRLEFDPISKGQIPVDPTLYVCAQDRGFDPHPSGPERFEIIMNAAPCAANETPSDERASQCQTRILDRLHHMGLEFSPRPGHRALTQPSQFNQLFPHSLGSLYGRSPHGMTAGLKRPMARTAIPWLYLAGGGAHPGAGVPMATLSGQHAAEAISTDLGLTSKFPATATRGGMSTGSRTVEPVLSPSSRS